MITKIILALAVPAALMLGTAPPASASLLIESGVVMQTERQACTIAMLDPRNSHRAYTAAHCYTGSPYVHIGNIPIGVFNTNIHIPSLDFIAIDLYNEILASNLETINGAFINGRQTPQLLDIVCKLGAASGETCGQVIGRKGPFWQADFTAKHGDSGSPVYRYASDGGIYLLGILNGYENAHPDAILFTPIDLIEDYLGHPMYPE